MWGSAINGGCWCMVVMTYSVWVVVVMVVRAVLTQLFTA